MKRLTQLRHVFPVTPRSCAKQTLVWGIWQPRIWCCMCCLAVYVRVFAPLISVPCQILYPIAQLWRRTPKPGVRPHDSDSGYAHDMGRVI